LIIIKTLIFQVIYNIYSIEEFRSKGARQKQTSFLNKLLNIYEA
jgi:hypothetical protein